MWCGPTFDFRSPLSFIPTFFIFLFFIVDGVFVSSSFSFWFFSPFNTFCVMGSSFFLLYFFYWPIPPSFIPTFFIFLLFIVDGVGSYQVGYTRSHPNTEVKMLRACSVPLCSRRWERQVIYPGAGMCHKVRRVIVRRDISISVNCFTCN